MAASAGAKRIAASDGEPPSTHRPPPAVAASMVAESGRMGGESSVALLPAAL